MGNNSNIIQHDIKFVQNLEDINFGQIQIYKNEEGKYIMMVRKTFMKKNDNTYQDYGFRQFMNYIGNDPSSQQFFTPIMNSNTKVQNICVVYEIIDTYSQYFNFTLADMIKHKKQMDKQEVWHCFYWFTKFALLLKQKGWSLDEGIILRKVFLTLKGTPTVSIHHLRKSSQIDEVKQKETNMIQEVAMCVLQLSCLTFIQQTDNLELFLRKSEKVDKHLGQLLTRILQKSITKQEKLDEQKVLEIIQQLIEDQKINVSKQIKLNKFKYIIPKPEQKVQSEQSKYSSSIDKSKSSIQKQLTINSLNGRKNKENMNLKSSNRKENTFDFFESRISGGISKTGSSNVTIGIGLNLGTQTPLNKTISIKNSLLLNDIELRKRQTQKQKQKFSERKQQILKGSSGSSGTACKNSVNKQNILGNSIREVRPSFNRKQSWTKRVVAQHLKQSSRN